MRNNAGYETATDKVAEQAAKEAKDRTSPKGETPEQNAPKGENRQQSTNPKK